MNALALIEGFIAGDAAAFVIGHALDEASVGQIRKQKPWFEGLIQHLRKEKVEDKYIPWIVSVLEKREAKVVASLKGYSGTEPAEAHWKWMWDFVFDSVDYKRSLENNNQRNTPAMIGMLVSLAKRFAEADKKKKWDKALKLGLLKNQRVKDIMFWAKPNVKVDIASEVDGTLWKLRSVLNRLERLRSRKDIKVQDADLIYKDKRFTVYSPLTHAASCQLGAGTRWCIASKSDSYFQDYTSEGQAFIFIMDGAADEDDFYKVAIAVNLFDKAIDNWDYYDAADSRIDEVSVQSAYGHDAWVKLRKVIQDYVRDREPEVKREEGDVWAGDRVEYDDRWSEVSWNKSVEDTRYWLLEPANFDHVPKETLQNEKLFNIIQDKLYDIYHGADGTVVAPTRTGRNDPEPTVEVKGTYGEMYWPREDINEFLDEWFPVPPKPENPLKKVGKQQWLPGMAKSIADEYQRAMDAWHEAQKPRDEFQQNVIKRLKEMSGGPWEDSNLSIYDIYVGWEIDPAESIKRYGAP